MDVSERFKLSKKSMASSFAEVAQRKIDQISAGSSCKGASAFRNTFEILHNLDRDELAGIVCNDKDWVRFNSDLTTFVLKLDRERLVALCEVVEARMPQQQSLKVAA